MKICFLCGSIESGRNGVGDYTRSLAKELISLGHSISIVAYSDSHVENLFDGVQTEGTSQIPVLRIPSSYSVSNRVTAAKKYINKFNPEWISLQFVPFSFHPKGLPFGLYKQLKTLGSGFKWHFMIHELWVGNDPGTNWKRGIYAWLQKRLIQRLLGGLKPAVIHTHLPVYKRQLEELGYTVFHLPLFSNIPVVATSIAPEQGYVLRIGMFSQVDTSSTILDYIRDISNQANEKKIALEIVLIGGNKNKMTNVVDIISNLEDFKGNVLYTGFLDSYHVSLSLHSCTFGLTPVPRHGLGKSGSVAAFLSHGVPVAAPNCSVRFDQNDIGFFSEKLKDAIIRSPDIDTLDHFKKKALQIKDEIQPATIAQKFELDLLEK